MNRYKLSKAGVNANEGIARFNGDKEMYENILMGFLKDTNFEALCQALEAKDVKAAFAAAHSLKGVAGNLSMGRLFDVVCPLVEELREGRLEEAAGLLPPVRAAYVDIIAALG